jgi:hypothetical protein
MTTPDHPSPQDLARELLLYKMQEYSQDGFCASWLVDLELTLWNAATELDPSPAGQSATSISRDCRILAEIAAGWWVFKDESQPDVPGPVFVSLDRWQQIRTTTARSKRASLDL